MDPHNFWKEEVRNVSSIITLVACNEVSQLGESIHDYHDSIFSSRGSSKGCMEVYANVIPSPIEALMEITLSHVTNIAS